MIKKITRNSAILTKNEDVLLEIYNKINEIIAELNPILQERESQIRVYEEAQDMYDNAILDALKNKKVDVVVEPADPYAEQRRWAGKLCWFWEDDPNDKIVDVLSHIDTARLCPFIQCDHQVGWSNCEPVKPTDDIIFKG